MLKRLLIVPLISTKRDVWRESDFITWFQFCQSWPDVFVYMLINPEAEIPEEYQLPNIGYVPIAEWSRFSMSQAVLSDNILQLFNPMTGQYQVDCVLTAVLMDAPFK